MSAADVVPIVEEDFEVKPEYRTPERPLFWWSNAPWVGTGYGSQTALFGPAVARLGYRLAFGAFTGLKGSRLGWQAPSGEGYYVYPGGLDPYGNDVLGAHAKHWFRDQKGLVILLTDPWVLNAGICSKLPMLAWTPVDHEPLMPVTHHWLTGSNAIPLAMSKFGVSMLERNGFKPLYAPHGFDKAVFHPGDREALRAELGIPKDAFLVGMVAANKGTPSRKCFSEAFQAFQKLREKCGRECLLYLHTKLEEKDGENLIAMADSLGLTPMSTDPYALTLGTPAVSVGGLMNCFDVLLASSQGEGFGCPIVESQACGTPTIVTNFSAMPEVAPTEVGNWNVSGSPTWTGFEAWQLRPDVEELTAALVEAYEEPAADRQLRRESVATWALDEYEVEYVTETYWKPVLEDAFARLAFRERRMQRA